MKSFKKVLGVVLGLLPFAYMVAFGAINPCITLSKMAVSNPDYSRIETVVENINSKIRTQTSVNYDFVEFDSDSQRETVTITLDMESYLDKNMQTKTKHKMMEIALGEVGNSSISVTNRNKIYNFISDSDTAVTSLVRQLSTDATADYARAYAILKPFSSPLGVFLGIMSLVIFAFLGVGIIFDLSYINLAGVQLLLGRNGSQEKPWGISQEAWKAVKIAESDTTLKVSSSKLYFSAKSKNLIFLFISLLYLVSGHLFTLLANLVDLFIGFI